MAKINRTWEKRSPKHQWTTFWMETLNKAFVQVPKYQKIPKKIGTEGGLRGVIIAPGLVVSNPCDSKSHPHTLLTRPTEHSLKCVDMCLLYFRLSKL